MKMLKFFLTKIFILSFVLSGTAFADLNEILDAGKVRIAVPESFAPFGSLGADGEHEGFDVDVAKLIAEDLGVELEIVPVTSKQRIPYLETDKVDLVISSMGANLAEQNRFGFHQLTLHFFLELLPARIKLSQM